MMELKEKVSDIDTLDHVGIMYLKIIGIKDLLIYKKEIYIE